MASGETLELSGFYVVFTSNIGSADLDELAILDGDDGASRPDARSASHAPELYARITEKLVFNRLSYDHQLEIAQLLLTQELAFLKAKDQTHTGSHGSSVFLVRRGFHPKLGARPRATPLRN